jgi:hypothetical protein
VCVCAVWRVRYVGESLPLTCGLVKWMTVLVSLAESCLKVRLWGLQCIFWWGFIFVRRTTCVCGSQVRQCDCWFWIGTSVVSGAFSGVEIQTN